MTVSFTIKFESLLNNFEKHPEIRKQLWGGEFQSDEFFVNTISKFGSEDNISKYVRNQGMEKEYKKLHYQQISLFQRIDSPQLCCGEIH